MRTLNLLALALLVAGGLNWLLVGLFSLDLVAVLFGRGARVVHVIVGLAALYGLALFRPLAEHHERLPHTRL